MQDRDAVVFAVPDRRLRAPQAVFSDESIPFEESLGTALKTSLIGVTRHSSVVASRLLMHPETRRNHYPYS